MRIVSSLVLGLRASALLLFERGEFRDLRQSKSGSHGGYRVANLNEGIWKVLECLTKCKISGESSVKA